MSYEREAQPLFGRQYLPDGSKTAEKVEAAIRNRTELILQER